ncbi:MAG: hypothetical protein EBW87_01005 [Burkholderiaceae bacterium]|nr:hypothetical protein [Burkholderiaceae bacterium]
MALVYRTGRDLSITVNSVTYNNVCQSATLSVEPNVVTGETIGQRYRKHIDRTATLTMDITQDWGSTSPNSIAKILADAYLTAPDTSLAFSMACGGVTISGKVFPAMPEMGGSATDVLTTTVALEVDLTGANTLTIA